MRKILCALGLAVVFCGAAFGASQSAMRRMGVFVSNFTEVGMYHIDADNISDSELAHFGEAVQARVTHVSRRGDIVIMRGVTYWPDNDEIEGSPFTATAEPYTYGGKNTWAILTLDVGD